MRDIETLPIDDDAYVAASPAGLPADTVAVDPSFADTKAYGMPSLGGEFGPGMVPVLSGPADGGEADLAAGATYVAPPALVIPTPASTLQGRSMNATFRTNLFPWFATPKAGLSSNRSSTPPALDDPPPAPEPELESPVTMSAIVLSRGVASFSFSGRATADAVAHIHYVIDGDLRSLTANIAEDDSATTVATSVREALRAAGNLVVTGSGGQIQVHSDVSARITDFEVTIERD